MARDDSVTTIDTDIGTDVNVSLNIKQFIHFETLLTEGMRVVDFCSSAAWSDTAEHDPGVTLIQALCYATSDVAYRHTLPLLDLLTPAPEAVPKIWPAQEKQKGIFPDEFGPHQTLTSGPITEDDYRRALLDLIFEPAGDAEPRYLFRDVRLVKENVADEYKYFYDTSKRSFTFIKSAENDNDAASVRGGYRLYLEPNRDVALGDINTPLNDFLATHRNLCEEFRQNDAGDVYTLVTAIDNNLSNVHITINLEDDCTVPEAVMAEIYQIVEQALRPQAPRYSASELSAQGYTNNTIYQGPNLEHGWIPELPAPVDYHTTHSVSLQSMSTALLAIEGVASLNHLSFDEDSVVWHKEVPIEQYFLPWGSDPLTDTGNFVSSVKLFKRGQAVNVPAAKIIIEPSSVINEPPVILPLGRWRKPNVYHDASQRIPPCYDLQTPPAEPTLAQQTQLHQFLLPFEQLLADSCDQLAKLPRLLSFNHRDDDSVRGGQWPFTGSSVSDDVHAEYKESLTVLSDTNKYDREVELSQIDALLGYFGNTRAQRTLEINDGQFQSDDFLTIQQAYLAQQSQLVYRRASIQIDDISALQKNIAARLGIAPNVFHTDTPDLSNLEFYMVEHRLLLPIAPNSDKEGTPVTTVTDDSGILTLSTSVGNLQSGQLIDLFIEDDEADTFSAVLVQKVTADGFTVNINTHPHLSNNVGKVTAAAAAGHLTWNYSDVWLKDMEFSLGDCEDLDGGTHVQISCAVNEPFPVTLTTDDYVIFMDDVGIFSESHKVQSVDHLTHSFVVEGSGMGLSAFSAWYIDRAQTPYVDRFTFCVSVVFPTKFLGHDPNPVTAAWFEQVVREEVAAHVNVLVHWMDDGLYGSFSDQYYKWQSAGNALTDSAYALMKSLAIGMQPYTSNGIGVMHVYDPNNMNDKNIYDNDKTDNIMTGSEIGYVPLGTSEQWPPIYETVPS
ncbi:MAG: hypothetical protein JKY31_04025 [Rhodobacteraceae bacterium]|nr:hypothetical protein [Paracoccaceae bacterium]